MKKYFKIFVMLFLLPIGAIGIFGVYLEEVFEEDLHPMMMDAIILSTVVSAFVLQALWFYFWFCLVWWLL